MCRVKPYLVSFILAGILLAGCISGDAENPSPFTLTSTTGCNIIQLSRDSFHSPKKAALLSTFLPGGGQAYNRKYWKIPIIYAAGAAGGYFIHTNLKEYRQFRTAYINKTDDDPNTTDDYPELSAQQLQVYRDYYRRNTELSVIFTTAFYLLQIIDATVDAHLFDFDVSNRLSLSVSPVAMYMGPDPKTFPLGFSVAWKFNQPSGMLYKRLPASVCDVLHY